MSSEIRIAPAVGVLAEAKIWHTGDPEPLRQWAVIEKHGDLYTFETENAQIKATSLQQLTEIPLDVLEPLAPAVTPGGLWDALCGVDGLRITGEYGRTQSEEKSAWAERFCGSDYKLIIALHKAGHVTLRLVGHACYDWPGNEACKRREEANDTAVQRFRALAAYAAQPGWGGGE